jgi:hypothetical protein
MVWGPEMDVEKSELVTQNITACVALAFNPEHNRYYAFWIV